MSLLAVLGAAWLVVSLLRSREDDAIRRVALLLFFPAAYVAGMSLSHAFTYFPWYYAPIYPFMAALVPIGTAAVARSSSTAVIASCRRARRGADWPQRSVVKLPADSTYLGRRLFRRVGERAARSGGPRRGAGDRRRRLARVAGDDPGYGGPGHTRRGRREAGGIP